MLAKLPPERQVLLDAADILEERGWIQGFSRTSDGYCIMGALDAASAVTEPARNALFMLAYKIGGPVPQWNDTPGRTKEEAIAMLRETALDGL